MFFFVMILLLMPGAIATIRNVAIITTKIFFMVSPNIYKYLLYKHFDKYSGIVKFLKTSSKNK